MSDPTPKDDDQDSGEEHAAKQHGGQRTENIQTVTVELEMEVEQPNDGSISFDPVAHLIGEGEYPINGEEKQIRCEVSRFRDSTEADIQVNFGSLSEGQRRVFVPANTLVDAAANALNKLETNNDSE